MPLRRSAGWSNRRATARPACRPCCGRPISSSPNSGRLMHDLRTAAARAPAISRNVEETSQDLPALLLQTQATTQQLEKLLIQLRGNWLLGGGSVPPEPRQLAPTQARP